MKRLDPAQPVARAASIHSGHRETGFSSYLGCSQGVAVAVGQAEMQRAMPAGPGRGSTTQSILRSSAAERAHPLTPGFLNGLTQHGASLPFA